MKASMAKPPRTPPRAAAPISLRATKRARVRDEIVGAAGTLFRERGFEATTIDVIAERAGVSRRTVFRYFDCKEAIVFADYARRLEEFRELLAARQPCETPLAAARRASLVIAEDYERNRRELLAQWKLVQSSPLLVAYELELDRGWLAALTENFARELSPFDARLLAGATLGVTRAVLGEWFESGGKADLIALGRRAFDLLEAGAAT